MRRENDRGRRPARSLPDAIAGLLDDSRSGFERGESGDEGRRVPAFDPGPWRRDECGADRGARSGRRPSGRPVMDQFHVSPGMQLLPGRDGVENVRRKVVLDQPAVVHGRHPARVRGHPAVGSAPFTTPAIPEPPPACDPATRTGRPRGLRRMRTRAPQLLGEQDLTPARLRRGDDESVPPRQQMAFLK